MKKILAAIALLGSSASAESYENHEAIVAFSSQPCAEFVQIIDGQKLAGSVLSDTPEETMRRITERGMMWGVLLGYDARAGGLHSSDQTTLERLRDACKADPNRPARLLLDAM